MTITNITERERELSARVATDAEIMAGLATMSQNYALKAKGFEEQLEIARGTLKNLWARVAELEAELEKAAIENKALTESAMMQREFKEPDDVEFGLIEQAATASFMKHQRSVKGQQITRSDSYETHLVWAAKAFYAGAQPVPEGMALVPIDVVNLYTFMDTCFVPMTPQQDQINVQLNLARKAMAAKEQK